MKLKKIEINKLLANMDYSGVHKLKISTRIAPTSFGLNVWNYINDEICMSG